LVENVSLRRRETREEATFSFQITPNISPGSEDD